LVDVAVAGRSAVTKHPDDCFGTHFARKFEGFRAVTRLDAEKRSVFIQPHFGAAVFEKREHADRDVCGRNLWRVLP